jgi:predicted DNA binding CopG/RHH family protein
MNRDLLNTLYPIQETLDNIIRALEDAEGIAELARELQQSVNDYHLKNNELKKQNHALQVFIEDHVPEEKKKLIFND